ncbi:Leucine-rich repeat (LRR) family protein [Euphorbia peplus]|nr:Leucine-rich repeat (LRR) family protein [Euphorbia peplus]
MFNSQTLFLLLIHLTLSAFPSHQHFSPRSSHPIVYPNINTIDLSALASIKDSLIDINPRTTPFFATWNFSSPNPCSSFLGLTCSPSNRVTSLTLGNPLSGSPTLAGSLSTSLSNLTQLTQLILYPGLVTGPIPPELGSLKNLRVISLTQNRLTGPIPLSISFLPNLHTLDLGFNQLTGSIPPGLFSSPQLKILVLSSNSISGELPTTITAPLLHLDLKNNILTGGLPLHLPSSLRYLSLSNNGMWGQLNGLETLLDLFYLDLSMNEFNGSITPSLFRPSLSSLLLQRNNLSGGVQSNISPEVSILPYAPGAVIDLSHNFLVGELPTVLADVESLFLNNNGFIGEVPEEYVRNLAIGRMTTLYLQHNYITEFPLENGVVLDETVSLCLSYNCFSSLPPVGLRLTCPASVGGRICRPESQCSGFHGNNQSIH